MIEGVTCDVYITQRAALASSLVKYIISGYRVNNYLGIIHIKLIICCRLRELHAVNIEH